MAQVSQWCSSYVAFNICKQTYNLFVAARHGTRPSDVTDCRQINCRVWVAVNLFEIQPRTEESPCGRLIAYSPFPLGGIHFSFGAAPNAMGALISV